MENCIICEARSGHVYNMEICAATHAADKEHDTGFSIVDRLY
jgi:hypothetical protein